MGRAGIAKPLYLLLVGLLVCSCDAGVIQSQASRGEIYIATNLMLTGQSASIGRTAQNGARFAVTTVGPIRGFVVKLLSFDAAAGSPHEDLDKGVQNVREMLSNPGVLGMVGPITSRAAVPQIPVANQASLVIISPTNSNPCLTRSDPSCDPQPSALRPTGSNNYFRIAALDTQQGPAMADYLVDRLDLKRVAVFSDQEPFTQPFAEGFSKELVARGGRVVARRDFDWRSTHDFRPWLVEARDAGAQAIYAAATTSTIGCELRRQSAGIFSVQFPHGGPDFLITPECLKTAGELAPGMYATLPVRGPSENPGVQPTVAAFRKAFPKKDDESPYTFPTYDATRILLAGIAKAIDTNGGKMPSREQVRVAMSQTSSYKGLTGSVTFDANGDTATPTLSIYRSTGSPVDWAFVTPISVRGR